MIKMDCEPLIVKPVRLVSLTDVSKLLLALVLLVEAIKPALSYKSGLEYKYIHISVKYIHIIYRHIYTLYKPRGLHI